MQAVKLPVLTGPPTKKLMFKAALRQSKCCVATRRGASQFRAAPVAAGILPAREGGIHASRTRRGQWRRERIIHRLAGINGFSRRAGSPALRQPGWLTLPSRVTASRVAGNIPGTQAGVQRGIHNGSPITRLPGDHFLQDRREVETMSQAGHYG